MRGVEADRGAARAPGVEIVGAESLGVRGLCCAVNLPGRRIVIDPGVALGYLRHGLLPHPHQVAVGRRVRERIVQRLGSATDVVFSHFHGDHVPLSDANPFQLSVRSLPTRFRDLHCWSKSDADLSGDMAKRFRDLAALCGDHLQIAEGRSEGPLMFSPSVPHGAPDSHLGSVMMTRIELGTEVFVHASDIQLLDDETVDRVIAWRPDIVLAAGPPLYLQRLSRAERERAWGNALRLARSVDRLVLDHHLLRSIEGVRWLDEVCAAAGRRVYCAADFMGRPRELLEAERVGSYERMPVRDGWHDEYFRGHADPDRWRGLSGQPPRSSRSQR
jgi:predicted metallo-beta-lactamase superfamily hydrolase